MCQKSCVSKKHLPYRCHGLSGLRRVNLISPQKKSYHNVLLTSAHWDEGRAKKTGREKNINGLLVRHLKTDHFKRISKGNEKRMVRRLYQLNSLIRKRCVGFGRSVI
jgi:hypothetical protein